VVLKFVFLECQEFKVLVVGQAGVGKTAVSAWLAGLPGWNRSHVPPVLFIPGYRIKFSMRSRIKHFWSMLIRNRFFGQKGKNTRKILASNFFQ
jgi:hypothetical protein